MKKILLLTVAMLSATTAYSMCVPPNLPKCKCQFPVFDGKELKCGEDYCEKVGKTCMDDGSCCQNDKVCGDELLATCCTDTQVCVNKTTCCPKAKAHLDENGSCVECTGNEHCGDNKTCSNNSCVEDVTNSDCISDDNCASGACNTDTNTCCPGRKSDNGAYTISFSDGKCKLEGSWMVIKGQVYACREEGAVDEMKSFCDELGYIYDSCGLSAQHCPFGCYAK